MTAPGDRCWRCDRDLSECGEAAAYDRYWRFVGDAMARQEPLDAWLALSSDCQKAKVDWRARCLTAEAEALASRALLREVVDYGVAHGVGDGMAERIREHLAGKP